MYHLLGKFKCPINSRSLNGYYINDHIHYFYIYYDFTKLLNIMKKKNLSTRELLLTIPEMKHYFGDLPRRNSIYLRILDYITNNDFSLDDVPLKKAKEVINDLGISPHNFKHNIDQIYNDILDLLIYDGYKYLNFGENKCSLYFSTYNTSLNIKCKLATIPRVGEKFDFNFIKPWFSTPYFFVLRVDHNFTVQGCETLIWLRIGSYNKFTAMEFDRRQFERLSKEWQNSDLRYYDPFAYI